MTRSVAWMDQGLCTKLVGFYDAPQREQVQVCGYCPVKTPCLEFVLAGPEEVGPDRTGIAAAGLLDREILHLRRLQHRPRKRAA